MIEILETTVEGQQAKPTTTVATWNVNSINARLPHVTRFLQAQSPDVLLLQELKGTEFPAEHFRALGYESVAVTQKPTTASPSSRACRLKPSPPPLPATNRTAMRASSRRFWNKRRATRRNACAW